MTSRTSAFAYVLCRSSLVALFALGAACSGTLSSTNNANVANVAVTSTPAPTATTVSVPESSSTNSSEKATPTPVTSEREVVEKPNSARRTPTPAQHEPEPTPLPGMEAKPEPGKNPRADRGLENRPQKDKQTSNAKRVKCGEKTCPAGQVCCNASCSICTPPGHVCIQMACN